MKIQRFVCLEGSLLGLQNAAAGNQNELESPWELTLVHLDSPPHPSAPLPSLSPSLLSFMPAFLHFRLLFRGKLAFSALQIPQQVQV